MRLAGLDGGGCGMRCDAIAMLQLKFRPCALGFVAAGKMGRVFGTDKSMHGPRAHDKLFTWPVTGDGSTGTAYLAGATKVHT